MITILCEHRGLTPAGIPSCEWGTADAPRLRDVCSEAHSDSLALLAPEPGLPTCDLGAQSVRQAPWDGSVKQRPPSPGLVLKRRLPSAVCVPLSHPHVPCVCVGAAVHPLCTKAEVRTCSAAPSGPGLWFCPHALEQRCPG